MMTLFLSLLGVCCCFLLADAVPVGVFTEMQNMIQLIASDAVFSTSNNSANTPETIRSPEGSRSSVPIPSSMQAYEGTSSSSGTLFLSASLDPASSSSKLANAPTKTVIVVPTLTSTDIALPTVTETVVVVAAPSQTTASSALTTPSPSANMAWAEPPQFTNLDHFNISTFGAGKQNLVVVKDIPPNARPAWPVLAPSLAQDLVPIWDNSNSLLQVFYPANSVDPVNWPQGGVDFYASPLETLHTATNVSFGYSVFFPVNFDWVRGGKLPGLYGGHMRCSGGDDARACFSTRLMWRSAGAGELYLYAPKHRQTEALCSHPLSVCDTTYGLSVGRGSFYFARGNWTHVKQTVSLNTPGKHDGQFKLEVNGIEVINRADVFYRDVRPVSPPTDQDDDGCRSHDDTGGLIRDLLGNLVRRCVWHAAFSPLATVFTLESDTNRTQWNAGLQRPITVPSTLVEVNDSHTPPPVGFSGLFFSTFFGGHEPEYATPIDQYTWFKDFVLTINVP